jgi:hypothetical protein
MRSRSGEVVDISHRYWHERNLSHIWKVSGTIGCLCILLDAGDHRATGVDPAVATYPTDPVVLRLVGGDRSSVPLADPVDRQP